MASLLDFAEFAVEAQGRIQQAFEPRLDSPQNPYW
jgi:hypothetical protein